MAELLRLAIGEKRFNGAPILAGLSVTVAAGEVVALVGPSGCGKSTALMLAAGLDRDFTGERHLAPGARLVVQFQEPCLLPWRCLTDNIDLALPPARRGGDTARRWLEAVELPAAAQAQFPAEVSLGMQRRAALARALAADGDLLLLDEPLVSLDAGLAGRLRALLLRRMAERPGLGLLIVTHDLMEAAQMADRILLLGGHPSRLVGEVRPDGQRGQRGPAQQSDILSRIARLQQMPVSPAPYLSICP
ncbi:ATP-binding cassette domain-containing protein [Niveispirillum sp.]|uniref:ATP-binding cassette domain-containing protein n=1 Tax=Niveispirillum sp. TaxID=1917217 RepID=UPI001B72C462|nr:ATP-binding cassette domain-containing protein [Niveispirillum sp.]MBP7338292.1 ATP-binding cassette domain-containing protein [Niveispirillum sp.]